MEGLVTQLCFRCDVSEAGPLISENDLPEDLLRFSSFTVVKEPVSESDQIISAWICLGVLACFGKFCFKVSPRLSREWRCDLFCVLEACLREYW